VQEGAREMFGEMRVDGDNSGFKADTEAIWRVGDESGLRRAAQSEWSRLQPRQSRNKPDSRTAESIN